MRPPPVPESGIKAAGDALKRKGIRDLEEHVGLITAPFLSLFQ
jgi:hypothetical protein